MYSYQDNEYAGLPYNDINWYDVNGQPFGIASYFNAIIFGNADNMVDTKGALAVGGNFVSSRGMSLAYGNNGDLKGTGYSPDFVRFLVGKNVEMQGPLVVIGHVVAGGNFRAGKGSTYMIGKDGSADQAGKLTALYQADGGSRYWSLSDRGTHYAVSSYDVPRFIPASRIQADTTKFFADAQASITRFHDCITGLAPNGTVTQHYHEWILSGNDPRQNVFLIDVRPNGILDKEIRFDIPRGSLGIVILRTGEHAHLKYGLWGDKARGDHTLYVFEDAKHIHMEVPAAIWGSILAPGAEFHAHQTGGTVNGNAAFGSLEVPAASGFEFHLYPFTGRVVCGVPEEIPAPAPVQEQMPEQVQAPVQEAAPTPAPAPCPECPMPAPCPPQQPCPEAAPCPTCPPQQPCPEAAPCPTCPPQQPCPEAAPCPTCPPQQPCPKAAPCPTCPPQQPCPEAAPCPECPRPRPCPECPPCPECEKSVTRIEIQPIPIPIPLPCPEQEECEECEECLITPGVIYGCIWGCSCCHNHEWEIKLYRRCGEKKTLLRCITICCCGCFKFDVPYDDFYVLEVCPVRKQHHRCCRHTSECKPVMTLKNVGVTNLMIE